MNQMGCRQRKPLVNVETGLAGHGRETSASLHRRKGDSWLTAKSSEPRATRRFRRLDRFEFLARAIWGRAGWIMMCPGWPAKNTVSTEPGWRSCGRDGRGGIPAMNG